MEKIRSDREWAKIIRAWDTSGKSQREYCRQEGVSFWAFRNRRAKRQELGKAEGERKPTPFIAVRNPRWAFSDGTARIRVIHQTGVCIEFWPDAEPERIRDIVRAVFTP